MNIKSIVMAGAVLLGALQAPVVFAADAAAAPAEATVKMAKEAGKEAGKEVKKKRKGNPRMKECSAEFKATGKKGSERKAFMSECLKKPKA